MSRKPIKRKLVPYRLLVTLLYGSEGWLQRSGTAIIIETGPCARSLKISLGRLHDSLEYLSAMGLLSVENPNFYVPRGQVRVRPKVPWGMKPDWEGTGY